jgi:thiamine-phosphate diphosphorylase
VAAGGAGARVLQLRIKPRATPSTADLLAAARMARQVTAAHGALLIVNDRLDVALAVDADGVHLGQDDLPLADARAVVARMRPAAPERPFLVGISTHNLAQVEEAAGGGADYLGFGPIYATGSKDNPDPVQGIAGLRAAVAAAGGTPIVAIGGIRPELVREVEAAGATAACAIAAVNHATDPATAGRTMGAAWTGRGRATTED